MKQRSPLRARAAEETKRREAPLKAPRVPRISRWGREREGGGRARRRHVSPREPPAPSPPAICGRGRAANACRRRRRPEPDRMGGFGGIVPPSLNEGRAACACLGVAPTGGAPAAARGAQPPPSPRPLSRAWGGAVSRGTRLPCPLLRAAAARLSCRRSPRRHRAAGRGGDPRAALLREAPFPPPLSCGGGAGDEDGGRASAGAPDFPRAAPLSPPATCGRGGRRRRRRFPRPLPAGVRRRG